MENLWKEFGSIFCINLLTRDDRYEESGKVFQSLGIPVEYFRTTRHPDGGARGCFESHIELIRRSYKRGDEWCVIFEDDVVKNTARNAVTEETVREVLRFMRTHEKWELFFLGSFPDIG